MVRIEHVNNQKCCGRCKNFKNFDKFNYCKNTWDNMRNTCKDCLKQERNSKKEQMSEYNKKYWQKTKEHKKQKDKEYRVAHYEHHKENHARWRREKYQKMKQENSEEFHKYKIKTNISRRIREILGQNKSDTCVKYVGCSLDELKNHLETTFSNGMSWDNYGEWHIDHIIPCTAFNMHDDTEKLACFNYKNLQALWSKDNIQKSNKFDLKQKELYMSAYKNGETL